MFNIFATLGPSTLNKNFLQNLNPRYIKLLRINLSHTDLNQIKYKILYLKKNKIKNICIDTEGAQIRTTLCKKKYFLKKNKIIKIYNDNKYSNDKNISLYPEFNIRSIKKNSIIQIGFYNLSLKVLSKPKEKKFILCKVIKSGHLESKKGVHIDTNVNLPALTNKDIYALKLANKFKIKYFAISFVNSHEDIKKVKSIIGNNKFIISKIETKKALINLYKIARESKALLIDRGDLSRYIPIEQIPVAQEQVIKFLNKIKKPTYVATNLLETMIKDVSPTRAESHDIYSSLKQGAEGLVLAAETAIGNDPISCVKFLKKCIRVYKKKIMIIN